MARDLAAQVPVGAASADAGPMLGPLVRLGLQATDHLEVGLRFGYLYGLDTPAGPETVTAAASSLTSLDFDARESRWTAGGSVGAGWVMSRTLPIDLRAHVAALDLLAASGPLHAIAVGASAGWTFWF